MWLPEVTQQKVPDLRPKTVRSDSRGYIFFSSCKKHFFFLSKTTNLNVKFGDFYISLHLGISHADRSARSCDTLAWHRSLGPVPIRSRLRRSTRLWLQSPWIRVAYSWSSYVWNIVRSASWPASSTQHHVLKVHLCSWAGIHYATVLFCHGLFFHFPLDGRSSCFWFSAMINKGASDILDIPVGGGHKHFSGEYT